MVTKWPDPALEFAEFQTFVNAENSTLGALVDALQPYQRGWPSRDLDLTGYAESDNDVLVSQLGASYFRGDGEDQHLHLHITFTKRDSSDLAPTNRRRRALERTNSRIRDVLTAIGNLGTSFDIRCTMAWRFPLATATPIVQLPLLTLDIPGTEFGRVEGIRFATHAEDQHKYVAIDLVRRNELRLLCHFVLSGVLSSDILEAATRENEHLKNAFIKQKDPSER